MLVKGLSISLDAGAFTSHLSGCMPSGYVEACLHVSQHPYMGSRVVSPAQGLIGFLRRICLSYSPSVYMSRSTGCSLCHALDLHSGWVSLPSFLFWDKRLSFRWCSLVLYLLPLPSCLSHSTSFSLCVIAPTGVNWVTLDFYLYFC